MSNPLPIACPVSDYCLAFHTLASRFARHNTWKLRRTRPDVSAEDVAQSAIVLLLEYPEKYALDPMAKGASAAVNDTIRDYQGGPARRKVRSEDVASSERFARTDSPEPEPYDIQAKRISAYFGRVVTIGDKLALSAAVVAADIHSDSAADVLGVSNRTYFRRRGDVAELLYRLVYPVEPLENLAESVLAGAGR
jgi:hypothetical protein